MEDACDGDAGVGDGGFGPVFGEFAYADDVFGFEVVYELVEGVIAVGEEFFFLGCGEFVGSEVCAGFCHEDEWAVVPHEEITEEGIGGIESLFCPAPET